MKKKSSEKISVEQKWVYKKLVLKNLLQNLVFLVYNGKKRK